MKVVIYRGSEVRLGHYGIVKPGDKLQLSEIEYQTVISDPRFELVEPKPVLRATDYIAPLPQLVKSKKNGAIIFDLRIINWKNPGIVRQFDRYGKSYVRQIGLAMRELGFAVDTATRMARRAITDSIISEAREAGWLSMEQRIISEPEPIATNLDEHFYSDEIIRNSDDEEDDEESEEEPITLGAKPVVVVRRRKKKGRR